MNQPADDARIAHLPHGPKARWVRHVVERSEDAIVGEGGAPPGSTLVRDGRLPVFTTLELCAQTAALLEMSGAEAPVAAQGYVVRARRVRLHHAWIDAGVPLQATVRRAGAAPPLYMYAVEVHAGEQLLLTGSIATFVRTG